VAALIVTLHVPVPVQPPRSSGERRTGGGRGGQVTAVPLANAAEQVAPQAMPAGALETVPVRRRPW